jgi:hypothetical protein
VSALAALALLVPIASAPAGPSNDAPALNLETLTGLQAERMMAEGTLTSVELTRAYIRRIEALNKSGPG